MFFTANGEATESAMTTTTAISTTGNPVLGMSVIDYLILAVL